LNGGKISEKNEKEFKQIVGNLTITKKNMSEHYGEKEVDQKFHSVLVRELYNSFYDSIN